ncbi:CHASE4 domain-containing protein [Sphingomonas kyeonggiensis]|uniref:histidine kinase n=1 Tax=Sphingomonas kyeonggiensis TaxID=1268553 RepID=A0A7W6NV89_9SPHN|nr:CHASE4 domain-containing protein [Sphingomonas kyeonggiensis]MBB4096893.1 signal transduction histidine kinase [Sphingomonas kyeonggiensis]
MALTRRLKAPASLGAKLVLILTGVGVIGAVALTVMLATVIMPSFSRLERDAVDAHVARTQAVVHDVSAKVELAVRDYGDWTSSYDYMANPTRAFEKESFSTLAMVNLDVNAMAYVRPDRSIVIARWLDLEKQTDVPAMRARLTDAIGRLDFAKVLAASKEKNSTGFFLRLGDTLVAMGIAQVRRSDGSGDPRGYVLMARTVTAAQLSKLLELQVNLPLDNPVSEITKTPGATRTRIAVPIPGPDGRPVATATYTVPRDLSTLGTRMLVLAVVGSSILLAIVLLVLRRMIARLVLAPLKRVESHMGVVRASGTLGLLTDKRRDDEIGSLVTSFNSMLKQLKDLREQLEVQSFTLGRSESAVAVMHNVRNALNPISTVLSQGLGAGAPMDRALLDRALSELAGEEVPAVRRQKLVAFLAAAIESVEQERADRREQIGIGRQALHHVLEIIGQQQEAAHERPPLDACDITDIVAQNATIARYSGETSIAFTFPSKAHWVMANRVILSQVVGNLFANAAEAIAATGRGSGSISVTIRDKGDSTEVHIRDDGEGFDPSVAPTLFQRGFSTRAHKSGGLGLHWCANSMLTMEGKLELISDGKGTGAKAILTLGAAQLAQPSGIAA